MRDTYILAELLAVASGLGCSAVQVNDRQRLDRELYTMLCTPSALAHCIFGLSLYSVGMADAFRKRKGLRGLARHCGVGLTKILPRRRSGLFQEQVMRFKFVVI